MLRKNQSTNLLPVSQLRSYKFVHQANGGGGQLQNGAESKNVPREFQEPKPESRKLGLKRSETHKVLFNQTFGHQKPKSVLVKEPPKLWKFPRSVNLRKKLFKNNVKFENANKTKPKISSEKVMFKKQKRKIIKWKDYIKMVKFKQNN